MHTDSIDDHFNSCLTVSAVFLIGSMLTVVLFVDDQGSTSDITMSNSDNNSSTRGIDINGERQMLQSPSSRKNIPNYGNNSQAEGIPSGESSDSQRSWLCKPDASVLLCTVQAAGWVGICAQSFFWTSWRGEEVGCIDLALQGVVGMVTAALIPRANAYFGTASVWCGSELFFHLLMMSVGLMSSPDESSTRWNAPRIVGALSGINYAVHATNGLILAADIVSDPSKRARTIAMVNNALPMGQLITAISGGVIAQYFGGFEYVFICYGVLGVVVTTLVWVYSSSQCLFSRKNDGCDKSSQ